MLGRIFGRALCALGVVLFAATLSSGSSADAERQVLRGPSGDALLFEARGEGPAPLVVMLHGMCDTPENECPWFAAGATPVGHLVCPRANLKCNGGTQQWGGKPEAVRQTVAGAMTMARAKLEARVDDERGNTLIGFSQGAFRAVDLATMQDGNFTGLVLIGASVSPDAQALKQAGIRRVLLMAGDFDGAKGNMVKATRALSRAGLDARFESLGKVGHTFPADMQARMTRAIAWVRGDDSVL